MNPLANTFGAKIDGSTQISAVPSDTVLSNMY